MNSGSEDPGHGFFFGPGRNGNRTQYVTLVSAVSLVFLFTLALYSWQGGQASSRWGYAMFLSVIPALSALLLLRLTRISLTWRGIAALYLILFLLVAAIAVGQLYTQFN
jgi:hypothetical protein